MKSTKIKKLILSIFHSFASYDKHKSENVDGLNFVPVKQLKVKEVFRGTITTWNNWDVPICQMPQNWIIGYVIFDYRNENSDRKYTATVLNGVQYKTWHENTELGLKQRDNNIIIDSGGNSNDAVIRGVYALVEEE